MAADLKRFTISITHSMEVDLDTVKKERYCQDTRNEMIRDLIERGLASLRAENEESCNPPKQPTQWQKPV